MYLYSGISNMDRFPLSVAASTEPNLPSVNSSARPNISPAVTSVEPEGWCDPLPPSVIAAITSSKRRGPHGALCRYPSPGPTYLAALILPPVVSHPQRLWHAHTGAPTQFRHRL